MKTISEIYTEYKIMPSLQNHMLRVAAVASLICDNFSEPVNRKEIITACLLHDMGNIIKSNLEIFPQFIESKDLEYWNNIKSDYINKYGNDESKAHEKIAREIGISEEIISLVNYIDFSRACIYKNSGDFFIKIINYADWRVSPYGVVSYDERMTEAKKRYKNHKDMVDEEKRQELVDCGKAIEKQIFAKCRIKPEDINNESVRSMILELKNFVVK